MALTGTIRKLQIDGVPYLVAADADFSETLTQFENSLIATSGDSIVKQEKRPPQVEDVVLITNGNDRVQLINAAEDGGTLTLSYTNRAGDTYRGQGTINVDTNTTNESRTTISLMPTGVWTASLA